MDASEVLHASSEDLPAAPLGERAGARPRSILLGNETLLAACGRLLKDAGHEIVAVVAEPGPAEAWARSEDLACYSCAADMAAEVGPVDYLFSITNLCVLPASILALAQRGAINFHDGPLPAYAGLNTPVWALLAGERQHGVTWHVMTEGVDRGAIVAEQAITVDEGETAVSLNAKCFEAALRLFSDLLIDLAAAIDEAQPQPHAPQRLYGRNHRPASAALIDWAAPSSEIVRLVQALDFGMYHNPLALPKARLNGTDFAILEARPTGSFSGLPPGTVVSTSGDIVVATGDGDLRLGRMVDLHGNPLGSLPALSGDRFEQFDCEFRSEIGLLDAAAAKQEAWWRRRLSTREPLQLPQFRSDDASDGRRESMDRVLPAELSRIQLLARLVAYLGRVADRDRVEIGYTDNVHVARLHGASSWFAPRLPLSVAIDWTQPADVLERELLGEIANLHKHVGIARDLIGRCPELRGRPAFADPVVLDFVTPLDAMIPAPDTILHIAIDDDVRVCRLSFLSGVVSAEQVEDLWAGFTTMLADAQQAPDRALGELRLLNSEERDTIDRWNAAEAAIGSEVGHYALFVKQAQLTPDKPAVTCAGASITYAELDARSNQMARRLAQLGVGPDVLVGIRLDRSIEMVVALLAVHKSGGGYVPLDPQYPRDRIAHMIADSGLKVLVTRSSLPDAGASASIVRLFVDEEQAHIATLSSAPFANTVEGHHLAYVIYTSGSTGLPKGVMVEHRNVLNFFAGMDCVLEPGGVWLAVTSLSFDISVLELCWPLSRGYHVVIATEREVRGDVVPDAADHAMGFSLFYFASGNAGDRYRLLLEGARFADMHGFEAVWTPERHFHDFGGPYPNPAVTSAAVAAVTSRVAIRAGSVVAPLHNPIRIAEEWAVVDNVSNGRVGIAFASGWQPDDFVLNPAAFADKKGALLRSIGDVRGLWRGERRSYPGPLGSEVEVAAYPRPVQAELPFWITTAGNIDSFVAAGQAGGGVLTHLLGQSVEELETKIAAYRAARHEAGHPGEGHVTLMLHTFVGEDREQVREAVREPLIAYLRASTDLLKQYAWSFPAFRRPTGDQAADEIDLTSLGPDEEAALLEHAFDRYFETSGLFGPIADCLPMVERLRLLGVNEIGCLIDFGVPTDAVLTSLPQLAALNWEARRQAERRETSLADLMTRHQVTHLQCTPSLAQVLASDPDTREGLSRLRCMMVGGEAFPPLLARDLRRQVGGRVVNMYGPTETTVWSAVHELDDSGGAPPLGRPLVNQQIYILDRRGELVRPGTPGELVIAGAGVVRGYHQRAELTAERFVVNSVRGSGRAYRTGDLARQRSDGTLEFLGRLDHQVKIRGYRIELGEIEVAIFAHPAVREVVVVPQGEGAATRLVAYFAAQPGPPIDAALRERLREHLPEFMIPAHFVQVPQLPRTPNGKIDRKALVAVEPATARREEGPPQAATPLQTQITEVWRDLLQVPSIGLKENFFDLGGHSLLAVQMHRRLSLLVDRPLALTDVFRFPTVSALAEFLTAASPATPAADEGHERARSRQAAAQRRATTRVLLRN